MKRCLVALLVAAAWTCARPALAHHSFAATYLETQSVTIEGEIVQFVFRNPHSFVHVNVKEKDGTTTVYNIEWGGRWSSPARRDATPPTTASGWSR